MILDRCIEKFPTKFARGRGNFLQNLRGVVRAVTRANERDGSTRPIRILGRGNATECAEVRAGRLVLAAHAICL